MRLKFSKMHGLGNDFVVFDAINQAVNLSEAQIRHLADRRFGIGCDQVLLVERPKTPDTEFYYRIFNADGGEVEQCGNGARCFARFVADKGLSGHEVIRVGTAKGNIQLYLEAGGMVRVNMGAPILEPKEIPFLAEHMADSYTIEAAGRAFDIGAASMGNPHLVLRVDDIDLADVAGLGPVLERHERFPKRVNVGFMQVLDRSHVRLRVYERGAGETLACGTGACAAVVSGHLRGWLDETVSVQLPGGTLVICWAGGHSAVWMTGSATLVFDGEINL